MRRNGVLIFIEKSPKSRRIRQLDSCAESLRILNGDSAALVTNADFRHLGTSYTSKS